MKHMWGLQFAPVQEGNADMACTVERIDKLLEENVFFGCII